MAYNKTVWENDKTPVNAENMNKIEQGIAEAHEEGIALRKLIDALSAGKLDTDELQGILDEALENKLDKIPETVVSLAVENETVTYTLQNPLEKVLIYPDWSESLGTADAIYIYINDVEYECFHSDLRVHTLPEDLYTYEHWSAGGGGTIDEEEVKKLWKAGAVIRAERVTAATVQMQDGYLKKSEVPNLEVKAPVKGVDYFTPEEVEEIKEGVKEEVDEVLETKVDKLPLSTKDLAVENYAVSYTLQSPEEKLIIYHTWIENPDGSKYYDSNVVSIFINDVECECTMHESFPYHTLPDDLSKYFHYAGDAGGSDGTIDEEEAKVLWQAGAVIRVGNYVHSATVQTADAYVKKSELTTLKQETVDAVLAALPTWEGGSY